MSIRDEEAYALACAMEAEVVGHDAATIIFGCCWLMAGIIVQCEAEREHPVEKSIALITNQLIICVNHLHAAQMEGDIDGPTYH